MTQSGDLHRHVSPHDLVLRFRYGVHHTNARLRSDILEFRASDSPALLPTSRSSFYLRLSRAVSLQTSDTKPVQCPSRFFVLFVIDSAPGLQDEPGGLKLVF